MINLLKRPLEVKCFKCKKKFLVKFNRAKNEYSKKNNWGYWTEREENKEKYICSPCFVQMYKEEKWEYLEAIKSLKKRELLRSYLRSGAIS